MAREQKIAIVTVHGTGDTAEGREGKKWFQQGSVFTERLRQKLAAEGLDAEIVPHLWSGANSSAEREKGAEKLVGELKRCARRYGGVHVIGHSHGGNVANDAAVNLKWGRRRKDMIHSLVTVGTPFLNSKTGWLQTLAGLTFLLITWGSAILFPIVALFWLIGGGGQPVLLFSLYLLVVGPSVLFMLAMSRRGARRILRPRKTRTARQSIFAIWHENDEAISFLSRIEELPLEPFPRGALFRGARSAALSLGVLSVIAVALVIPLWITLVLPVLQAVGTELATNTILVALLGLWLAPVVFIVIYGLYRYLVGGVAELGARAPLNGWVTGVLRGIALGRDGDQVLCNVSPTSHTHETEARVLGGEVAQRMQAGATDAAGKLIEKYRWSLFTVGSDTNSPLASLASDAMTWESMIHTTYFDQPEVAELIAAHIAARAKA